MVRAGLMSLMALTLLTGFAFADAKQEAETRRKWENIVQFYGQEDTNLFSLAIYDRVQRRQLEAR